MLKLATFSWKGISAMKTMTALAVAAFILFGLGSPLLAQSEASKTVIITMRAKSSADTHLKVLQALHSKTYTKISSNGNSDNEFVALVAEVPASVLAGSAVGAATSKTDIMNLLSAGAADDVIDVEEDFSTKWIEAMPSFQGLTFPSVEAAMGALPKLNLSLRAGMRMASLRPSIPWGVDRVHAPAAWDNTQGKGVRIAVIDTGIFTNHPDLQGKVDGGYDTFTKTELRDNYQDKNGHGTHVAGTIAANGVKLKGVAPLARLYAVRVLDPDGSGSISGIIDGLIWCAKNHIQVANMSLGSDKPSPTLQQALRYVTGMGIVVVAAAGNSGGAVGYPAAYPEAIAVSASDSDDHIASFSSRGEEVKFIAPGVNIVSSAMDGGYANMSGTSMASPHVAGLVALAVSQGWVGKDGPDGVLAQLQKAAKGLSGLDKTEQGFGMIDAGLLTR
jgi:subtilisin family serine protease